MKKFMKKFGTLFISLALVLVMVPVAAIFAGCGKEKEAKIKIFTEFKTEYYVGEALDVSTGVIEYINEEGKSKYVPLTNQMIAGFSTETAGTKNMVITYEDAQLVVSYTVSYFEITESTLYSWTNTINPDSEGYGHVSYLYVVKTANGIGAFGFSDFDIDEYAEKYNATSIKEIAKKAYESEEGWMYYSNINTKAIKENKVVYSLFDSEAGQVMSFTFDSPTTLIWQVEDIEEGVGEPGEVTTMVFNKYEG